MSISKQTVSEIHEQQLSNGENNADNTTNIVRILGGIDSILRDYLTKQSLILSIEQLQHIKQTLTTPQEYQQQNKPKSLTIVTDDTHSNRHMYGGNNPSLSENMHMDLYVFDVNDTFLNSLCSETTVKRIKKVLRNTYLQVAMCLNIFIYFALDIIIPGIIAPIYGISMVCCVWIPYGICWLLSSNREAFYLILKSFEFWYKSVYSVIFGVLLVIYLWRLNANRSALSAKLYLALNVLMNTISVPIATVVVSSFDALQVTKNWKCALSICMALIFTFEAVIYQFIEHKDNDYVINIASTAHSVSFQSMLASASRGLSIFFWKQAIFALVRTKKAMTIHNTPIIKWNEPLSKSTADDNEEAAIKNEINLSAMNKTAEMRKKPEMLEQEGDNEDEDSVSSSVSLSVDQSLSSLTNEANSKEKIEI